jgi:hypothetical protein
MNKQTKEAILDYLQNTEDDEDAIAEYLTEEFNLSPLEIVKIVTKYKTLMQFDPLRIHTTRELMVIFDDPSKAQKTDYEKALEAVAKQFPLKQSTFESIEADDWQDYNREMEKYK